MPIDGKLQIFRSRFHKKRLHSSSTLLFLNSMYVITAPSCKSAEDDNKKAAGPVVTINTFSGQEPALMNVDSIVIIIYDDSIDDSLRYSRYYQFTSTSDLEVLDMLREHWKQQPTITDTLRPCRSQGKLQLFVNDNPVKTVYYADKEGGCKYLYFIRDGLFYYFETGIEFNGYLAEVRKKFQQEQSK